MEEDSQRHVRKAESREEGGRSRLAWLEVLIEEALQEVVAAAAEGAKREVS